MCGGNRIYTKEEIKIHRSKYGGVSGLYHWKKPKVMDKRIIILFWISFVGLIISVIINYA